uniref:Uncharacterized protein n=1 Tax=Trypanosoma vivax (strain Y486) TaxID=1055687 RepID=G0UAW4_TRYVY|nr:hypothetical protein TVY486_1104350 [Trypanosoma vivax Y486]
MVVVPMMPRSLAYCYMDAPRMSDPLLKLALPLCAFPPISHYRSLQSVDLMTFTLFAIPERERISDKLPWNAVKPRSSVLCGLSIGVSKGDSRQFPFCSHALLACTRASLCLLTARSSCFVVVYIFYSYSFTAQTHHPPLHQSFC